MKSEADVVNYFIARAKKDKIDIMKVQATTMSGVPDLNACRDGVEVWIEMKLVTSKGVLLRPEQWAWGHRRSAFGGRVFVMAVSLDRLYTHVFTFPHIIAEPCGKYVKIVNGTTSHGFLDDNFHNIVSYLFT